LKIIVAKDKGQPIDVFVDDADYEILNRYWRMKRGYPLTKVYSGKINGRSRQREVPMHRYLLGDVIPEGMEVDHINRNKLDNRRMNLRIVTPQQNKQNVSYQQRNVVRIRGVQWDKANNRYKACARLNGKLYSLGYYDDPDAAAIVVSGWRAEHMSHTVEG